MAHVPTSCIRANRSQLLQESHEAGPTVDCKGRGYQYRFSIQPHDFGACRSVSPGIENGLAELAENEPGLQSALTT
jgi:hypothetical protein